MKKHGLFIITLLILTKVSAQESVGEIHGDFDLNMQTYSEDKLIGAEAADEILLNNAYLNLNYRKGNFAVFMSES